MRYRFLYVGAEISWSDTMHTLPDHQGRLEDYSPTSRWPM